MRISDWSSDVCSSDLVAAPREHGLNQFFALEHLSSFARERVSCGSPNLSMLRCCRSQPLQTTTPIVTHPGLNTIEPDFRRCASLSQRKTDVSVRSPESRRSEEHTSELQSLMRISYAVFCLKKKNTKTTAK